MNTVDFGTRRVLSAQAPTWPLHGIASSRAIETAAHQGFAPHTLMTRAGMAVARLAIAVAPHAQHIWIAAGPGNNGGDGLRAAVELKGAGRRVQVSWLGDADRLPDDARLALQAAQDAGVTILSDPQPGIPYDFAIDALLGLGSSRPPEGAIADAIRSLNARPSPVLAVDLPTGLDAALGRLNGPLAVHAAHTLALLTLKPGLFTGAGRDQCGTVWFDTLGTVVGASAAMPADAWLFGAERVESMLPQRRHAQHKGSFGDVLVVGGAPGTTGAAWLAARAALCAGAGRVYVDALAGDTSHNEVPELMCKPGAASHLPDMLAQSTVTCGCGGGKAVADVLPTVLMHSARLVLDADALNAIASDAALQILLTARHGSGKPTLLTPHPLEAARLLSKDAKAIQDDRFAASRALAQRFRCAVLLKGSGSICAAPDHPPIVNPTGNALLSTAGTGDVLAGWAGGIWAQQPKPDTGDAEAVHAQAQAVGAAAAWLHGHAADVATARGRTAPLTASALIDALTAELRGALAKGA